MGARQKLNQAYLNGALVLAAVEVTTTDVRLLPWVALGASVTPFEKNLEIWRQLWRVVERIENGHGRPEDLDLLNSVADGIQGRTICALGDAAAMPVRAMIKNFREEFAHHIEHKTCMVPAYI